MRKIILAGIAATAVGSSVIAFGLRGTGSESDVHGATQPQRPVPTAEHLNFCHNGHLQDPACADVWGGQRPITGKIY